MFSKIIYKERREKLKARVGRGLILFLGNEESSMNYGDNCYHFRQDSNFLYFFGIDRPSLVALIDIEADEEILFGNDTGVEDIIWTGPLETLREQADQVGVAKVQTYASIEKVLRSAQSKGQRIHFLPPYRPENKEKLRVWLDIPLEVLGKKASVDLIKAVVALRSIKENEEIAEIEKGVNTTVEMQKKAAALSREGVSETEIAGLIHGIAISAGGNIAFPTIMTVNGQVLHNHSQGNVLHNGQMLLCDCGAETAMHYGGDLTRTTPVDDHFSTRQKEIYDIVVGAHEAAVAALRPGILFKEVHLIACEKLVDGLKAVGLMKGDPKEAVAKGAHAMFFQCGLGHMLGLDTHDMEDLGEAYVGYTDTLLKSTQFGLKSLRLGRQLEPGFVLTVEPGIYIIPQLIDWWRKDHQFEEFICYDRLEKYKDFGGIRIEEDFLITPAGYQLLGHSLERDTEMMKSAVRSQTEKEEGIL